MAKSLQDCASLPTAETCSPAKTAALSQAFQGLNGYLLSAFRGPDSVYGELASIEEYISVLKKSERLGPDSLFVDLGSGLGKPAAIAACLFSVKCSYGIERVPSLFAASEKVRMMLERDGLVRPGQLVFARNNIHRCREVWLQADVVYVCCLTWSRRSLRRLCAGLSGLKPGAEVFTSAELPNKDFKLREVMEPKGDWGRTQLLLYTKQ